MGIGDPIKCAHCGESMTDEISTPTCVICGYHICPNCSESNCPKK